MTVLDKTIIFLFHNFGENRTSIGLGELNHRSLNEIQYKKKNKTKLYWTNPDPDLGTIYVRGDLIIKKQENFGGFPK